MTTQPEGFSTIEDAVAAIGRGEIVVVVDDEDRENEGDHIMAAEAATPENLAFFVRHTSGVRQCVGEVATDGNGVRLLAEHHPGIETSFFTVDNRKNFIFF